MADRLTRLVTSKFVPSIQSLSVVIPFVLYGHDGVPVPFFPSSSDMAVITEVVGDIFSAPAGSILIRTAS